MKKLLPPTRTNTKGFTLVELLVVIVILAIIGVIGMTVFTGIQSRARDAKRKADINAMSKAMETNYNPISGYSTVMYGSWFAEGSTPTNPNPGGSAYYQSGITTAAFTFCAYLENSTGNATTSTGGGAGTQTGIYYCKKNSQ